MKAGIEHRVPLCDEAMQILTKMQEWRLGDSERVSPEVAGAVCFSDVAVNKTLHSIVPNVTVYGFRSSFRDWAQKNRPHTQAQYIRGGVWHT